MSEYVCCNLCGSDNAHPLYQLPDILLDQPAVVSELVSCNNCSLVYQNPRPSFEEMAAHYPDDYESYNYEAKSTHSWLIKKAHGYGVYKRCRELTKRSKPGKLLDIGCSTGIFMRGMISRGWDVVGVEIGEYPAEIARNRFGLRVHTGTVESAQFDTSSFDAVSMWDVFEHLHDPAKTLAEVKRILKPNGLLVLRVPNLDSWDAKLFKDNWAGFDAPRHTYIFGRQTIRQMLTRNGFNIVELNCNIGSYPTFLLSLRFWMRQKGFPANVQAFINRFLGLSIMRLVSAPLFSLGNLGQRGALLTVIASPKTAD